MSAAVPSCRASFRFPKSGFRFHSGSYASSANTSSTTTSMSKSMRIDWKSSNK
jgi:hypothetical protein